MFSLRSLLKLAIEKPNGFETCTKTRRTRRFFKVINLEEGKGNIYILVDLTSFRGRGDTKIAVALKNSNGGLEHTCVKSEYGPKHCPPESLAANLFYDLDLEMFGPDEWEVTEIIKIALSEIQ